MNRIGLRAASCAVIFLLAHGSVQARRLNDTGQVNCYSVNAQTGTVSPATPNAALPDPRYERQDCTRGLAAADAMGRMTKIGASSIKGRDYSKIANNGTTLAAAAALGSGAADWACTRDNITGLVWEVKTSDGGVRDFNKTYLWANAGQFPATVNALALCGYTDWRLPTPHELLSLIDGNANNPAIDGVYFPNTVNGIYWSGVTHAGDASFTWYVRFSDGFIGSNRGSALAVRLVRGAP
jgi:Protein of unknown function (DUF1566)